MGILDMFTGKGMLGMGGIGGALGGGAMHPALLQSGFDPAALRKMQIKRGLLQGGIAMMGMGPSEYPISFGQQLATGLGAGLQGADQAQDDYTQQSLLGIQLGDRKAAQARQVKDDAWQNTQRARQMTEWDETDDKKKQKRDYIDKLLMSPMTGVPVQNMGQANQHRQMGDYDAAGEALMAPPAANKYTSVGNDSLMFDETNKQWIQNPNAGKKPPQIETFFDEKTGQQYKAQYNPQTGQWDPIGGKKAAGNGITITNPDGTVTQIGGSGGNKTTEADRRAILLARQIAGQPEAVERAFDDLATVWNTVGRAVPGGRAMMTEGAQVAEDAMKNIISNWIYLTSGATAPDAEVERTFSMVKPSAMDHPEAIAAKKARLMSMVAEMNHRAGILEQKISGGGDPSIDELVEMFRGE